MNKKNTFFMTTLPFIVCWLVITAWHVVIFRLGNACFSLPLTVGIYLLLAVQNLICNLLLYMICGYVLKWRNGIATRLWCGGLFFVFNLILLLDTLLLYYSGTVWHSAYFVLVLTPREMWSFMKGTPVLPIIIAIVFAIVMAAFFIWTISKYKKILLPSKRKGISLLAAAFLIFVLSSVLPGRWFEFFSNVYVRLSLEELYVSLNASATDSAALLRPQGEVAEYIGGEEYPLWRITKEYTGEKVFEYDQSKGAPRHIVLVIAESFRGVNVGTVIGPKHSLTPEFDKLSRKGVLFTNFYSTGVVSLRMLASVLYGTLPYSATKSLQEHFWKNRLRGLPQIFADRSYQTALFNGCTGELTLIRRFLKKQGVQVFKLEEELRELKPPACQCTSGGLIHDEFMLDQAWGHLSRLVDKNKKSFTVLFTTSNHVPFETPENPNPKNLLTGFMNSMRYTDKCIAEFVNKLLASPAGKDSMVIIIGDHGFPLGEHSPFLFDFNLHEESVLVPLLILAPGRIKPKVINSVCSGVDLPSTVLDLLNFLPEKNSFCGRSLWRKNESESMAFFFNSEIKRQLGVRWGRYKYIYDVVRDQNLLFDEIMDRPERHNIAARFPELVTKLRGLLQEISAGNNSIIRNNRLVAPSWQEVLLNDVPSTGCKSVEMLRK
jgi:phosphoglycerol transferase MdoB-like AlkP superfamily enzyme